MIQKEIEVGGLKYILNDDDKTAGIHGCTKPQDIILIPRSIEYNSQEYVITIILESAFESVKEINSIEFSDDSELQIIDKKSFLGTSITNISIPIHVTKICDYAFKNCCLLKKVEIPKNSELQIIGKYAFEATKIKIFTIPKSLVELGKGWCKDMQSLAQIRVEPNNPNFHLTPSNLIVSKSSKEKEGYNVLVHSFHNIFDIEIPNDIEIIGPYAFYLCKQLKTINFYKDSKLRIIDKNAFSYTRIRSLKIPKSLVELKNGWNNQSKICKLEIDQDNPNFTLYDDNLVLSKSSKDKENFDVLELSNDKEITKATIPNFIKIIKSNAFLKCRKLKNIDFQENSNLQIINKHAFELTSIESLTIPSHVKIIKPYAVSKCRYLKKVDFLPDCELQMIDSFSFGFSSIRKISFPAHVKIIKENAFFKCIFLSIIEFPSNSEIQKIDKNAFGANLISEFTIPPSLHYFDYDWFNWRGYDRPCDQYIVKKLNVLQNNPYIKVIDNTFVVSRESEENENFNTLIFVSDNFERIKIPNFIQVISQCAFFYNRLLKEVEFEENSQLKIIGEFSFYDTSLQRIKIPASVTQICESAFDRVNSLKEVEIPKNSELQKIGYSAFYFTNIESFTIPSKVNEIGSFWLNSNLLFEIKVDKENQFFSSINNKFIVSKSSPKSDVFDVLFFSIYIVEKNLKIPDFIRIIGDYSFYENKLISKIIFPFDSKLQIIEKYAFFYSSISEIKIPSGVEIIGENAFHWCGKLKRFEIPGNSRLKVIGKRAFYSANTQSIWVPPSVSEIGEDALYFFNVQIIQFEEDSKLKAIERNWFSGNENQIIMIPVNLNLNFN